MISSNSSAGFLPFPTAKPVLFMKSGLFPVTHIQPLPSTLLSPVTHIGTPAVPVTLSMRQFVPTTHLGTPAVPVTFSPTRESTCNLTKGSTTTALLLATFSSTLGSLTPQPCRPSGAVVLSLGASFEPRFPDRSRLSWAQPWSPWLDRCIELFPELELHDVGRRCIFWTRSVKEACSRFSVRCDEDTWSLCCRGP